MNDENLLFNQCREKTNQVSHTCQELRKYLLHLKEMKTRNRENPNSALSDEDKKFLTKGHMLFLQLRAAHREACAMNDSLNSRRFQFQSQTDSMSLKLNNLQYEAYNLQHQIRDCKKFHSRHTSIPLISREEFDRRAPTELKQGSDEHAKMMNQLQFELLERKRFKHEIEELAKKQLDVKEQIANKKKFVDGLKGNLNSIRDLAVTVQKNMIDNIPPSEVSIIPESEIQEIGHARKLPFPLYTLFNKLNSYRKHFVGSHVQVKIQEYATPQANNQKEEETADSTSEVHSNDSNIEELPSNKRVKRTLKASINNDNLKPHDLSISVRIDNILQISASSKKTAPSVVSNPDAFEIIFYYLPNCNLITVSGGSDKTVNQLLATLFPNDNGIETPDAERLLDIDFSDFECGRPYRWAQSLCGLHFLTPAPLKNESDKMKNLTIHFIIESMRYRTQANKVLANELKDLLQARKLPKSPLPSIDTSVSIKFSQPVKLTSFSRKTDAATPGVYIATFKSGNTAIQCQVIIHELYYPLVPPLISNLEFVKSTPKQILNFAIPEHLKHLVQDQRAMETRDITVGCNTDLTDIEYETNILFPIQFVQSCPFGNENHFRLLSHQMAHLVQCLNIYLQIEADSLGSSVTPNKFYLKERRGKDRRLPLSFNKELSLFTQSM